MAQVIGVVSGVIGIFQFLQSLFPPQTTPSAATSSICIGVGLDGTFDGQTLSDAQGAVKGIRVYNEEKLLIGTGKGDGAIQTGGVVGDELHCLPGGSRIYERAAYIYVMA